MKIATLILLCVVGVLDLSSILFCLNATTTQGIERMGTIVAMLVCIPVTIQAFLLFRRYKNTV